MKESEKDKDLAEATPEGMAVIEQQLRIATLRATIERILGPGRADVSAKNGLDNQESFLGMILAYECNINTTIRGRMKERFCYRPPVPKKVSEAALAETLWTLIENLARVGIFLARTDHLTDAEVYEQLHKNVLPQHIGPQHIDSSAFTFCMAGMTSNYQNDHADKFLSYYATDEEREKGRFRMKNGELPPKRALVSDRDRRLPVKHKRS